MRNKNNISRCLSVHVSPMEISDLFDQAINPGRNIRR